MYTTGHGSGHFQQDANSEILGNAASNCTNYQQSSSSSRQTQGNQSSQRENTATGTGRSAPRGTQGQTNGSFPYRNPRYDQQRGTQPQAQFDERFN